jgi:hypothetical protein
MPKGWLYNWEGHGNNGKAELRDTFLVESFVVVYLCVSSLSLIDA